MQPGIGHNGVPQLIDLDIATPAVFEPFLTPSRYKAAHGGRGSGKSHFFAELVVELCILHPGLRVVCIREVQLTLAQSVRQLIVDKISKLGVSSLFGIKKDHIDTPGGGIIIFRGMQSYNADSIKSLEGFDIAWVEEAQSFSAHSLELLRPTIRRDPTPEKPFGSEIWFSWNPAKPDDPVDRFFRGGEPPPNAVIVQANWRDNPFFPDVLREEMEYDKRRNRELYEHVWEGEYVNASEARVFRNWKVAEFETPERTIFYGGADWGFAVDPSVMVRCFIIGRTIFIDHEAYAIGCEIDQTPFLFAGARSREIRLVNGEGYTSLKPIHFERWQGIPQATSFTIRADSARPETISYMQKHGFPKIVPAIKGAGSVEEGIKFLQSYDIVIHPRCIHTIDEFKTYSYKVDKKTKQVTSVLEDRKNHVIDSVRYALEDVRRHMVVNSEELLI